ncbi:MAG TPA: hypothetical protein HPP94_03060 [Desulfuromonadales bacterium]|nr:hypothetical protein [Desulfuromonadales bacterium]
MHDCRYSFLHGCDSGNWHWQTLSDEGNSYHSCGYVGFFVTGQTGEGRLLRVTFTIRTNKIRVISVRDMHRKERTVYEQEA